MNLCNCGIILLNSLYTITVSLYFKSLSILFDSKYSHVKIHCTSTAYTITAVPSNSHQFWWIPRCLVDRNRPQVLNKALVMVVSLNLLEIHRCCCTPYVSPEHINNSAQLFHFTQFSKNYQRHALYSPDSQQADNNNRISRTYKGIVWLYKKKRSISNTY